MERKRLLYWQLSGPNPLNHRDDFSRPALRHGNLNSLPRCINLNIRCILGDVRLWVGDPSTSSCLVSLDITVNQPSSGAPRVSRSLEPCLYPAVERIRQSEFGTNKTVKARFWPWLETFSGKIMQNFLSCSLLARQWTQTHTNARIQGGQMNLYTGLGWHATLACCKEWMRPSIILHCWKYFVRNTSKVDSLIGDLTFRSFRSVWRPSVAWCGTPRG